MKEEANYLHMYCILCKITHDKHTFSVLSGGSYKCGVFQIHFIPSFQID